MNDWKRETMTGAAPEATASALVKIRRLTKSFGNAMAVKPLDLDIAPGDFFAILGPSGCGKTTLLRMLGGFVPPTGGTISISGRDVTRLPANKRPTNMVFQGYGLFPNMTVRQNIAYGPRITGVGGDALKQRVDEVTDLVRLGDLRDRNIAQLSGGQQQRVALARALVMRPPVLLLDEPLAALDLKLRQAMQDELRRIHQEIGGTFVFVTHDQNEAMNLANRIAVMIEGSLVQVSSTLDLYRYPNSEFVATFVGDANVLDGNRRDGTIELEGGIRFPHAGRDGPVRVVVRPEDIALAPGQAAQGPDSLSISGAILQAVFMGPVIRFQVRLDGTGGTMLVHAPLTPFSLSLMPGERVTMQWSPASLTILNR
jgi:spermidine/putrescine transport system ATP-binding protein